MDEEDSLLGREGAQKIPNPEHTVEQAELVDSLPSPEDDPHEVPERHFDLG